MKELGNSKKGFTLVELMIVIAIVGILAAVVVPQAIEYKRKEWVKFKTNASDFLALCEDKTIRAYLTIKYEHPDEADMLWRELITIHEFANLHWEIWNAGTEENPPRNLWKELLSSQEELVRKLASAKTLAGDSLPSLPDGAQIKIDWEYFLK